jgi:exosortase/archaeosortase family protein
VSARRSKDDRKEVPGRIERVLPHNSVRRVAVVFVILLAVFLPLTTLNGAWSGWQAITGETAFFGGTCARSLGINATVVGSVIHLPSRSLLIDTQCTGVTLMAVYIALVLAYPVSWKMRTLAIVAGIPILFAVNIARVVGVAWASELLPGQSFYLVHDYLFEFGMVFAVLMTWAVWLSIVRRTA